MLGIICCAIYIGFQAIMNQPLEAAVHDSANFLWYWYSCWGVFAAFMLGLMFFGGSIGTVAARSGENKLASASIAFVGFVYAIVGAISYTLYLVGTYLIYYAGDGTMPFAEWNMQSLVVGGIMYVIAILFGFFIFSRVDE